uniref:Calcyon neuron specific vesicular protein n=1 Tax=Aotus nancymaae TaxID=37293 RepID=A0A2K5DNY8_AOTNA
MVKLGCSFSGKPGKDPGDQDAAAMDSVPLISLLDVSQLQLPLPEQVVIKTQTAYQLSSSDQPKKFPDLEGQKPNCSHPEEGRRLPMGRMIAFTMALMGCVLILYGGSLYDQFSAPSPLPQHKLCAPLTLEMYYAKMDPERHRSVLAAIEANALSRKHSTEPPAPWGDGRRANKEERKRPTQAGAAAATEPPGKPSAEAEKEAAREAARKAARSAGAPAAQ